MKHIIIVRQQCWLLDGWRGQQSRRLHRLLEKGDRHFLGIPHFLLWQENKNENKKNGGNPTHTRTFSVFGPGFELVQSG